MIDTYVSGPVKADLEAFAGNFINFIPCQPGRVAQAASTDPETGQPIPAIAAVGDPTQFYTCVRATIDITPIIASPLVKVDPAIGASVVGVWA